MKRVLFVFCLFSCLFCCTAVAQQPPAAMTRLQVRMQSPDLPANSFAALPKVIYRAGEKYCRVEEQPDPQNGIDGLVIINEPDAWMVNLANHTAEHTVDAGPSFDCRMPIFGDIAASLPADESKPILGLEFGHELEFFKKYHSFPRPGGVVAGRKVKVYILQFGKSSLALFTFGKPARPLGVVWKREGKQENFWYSAFAEMAFDPTLFAKPENVKIVEAKP